MFRIIWDLFFQENFLVIKIICHFQKIDCKVNVVILISHSIHPIYYNGIYPLDFKHVRDHRKSLNATSKMIRLIFYCIIVQCVLQTHIGNTVQFFGVLLFADLSHLNMIFFRYSPWMSNWKLLYSIFIKFYYMLMGYKVMFVM